MARKKIIDNPCVFKVGDTVSSLMEDNTLYIGFVTKSRLWGNTYTYSVNKHTQVRRVKFISNRNANHSTIRTRRMILSEIENEIFFISEPEEPIMIAQLEP